MLNKIQILNDAARKGALPCKLLLTQGVSELPDEQIDEVLHLVRTYDNFNEDNDPHQEHDFGQFDYRNESYFFKFDYYDSALLYWGDPKNINTQRVLTVMRADEY